MTTFDLSPLLRSSVGFDAFDNIFDSVFNMNETGRPMILKKTLSSCIKVLLGEALRENFD